MCVPVQRVGNQLLLLIAQMILVSPSQTLSDIRSHAIWTTVPVLLWLVKKLIKCGCKAVPMCAKNCKCQRLVWRVHEDCELC